MQKSVIGTTRPDAATPAQRPGPDAAGFQVPDDPPLTSADAARALHDLFLANTDHGANTANDELVAELVRRIRALQGSSDSGRSPQATEPFGWLEAGGR
ncbi:MAG: hypothetical protein ACRDS0_05210 [Pseudonocardiaceae bacterium]